jgi:hypothetical protein
MYYILRTVENEEIQKYLAVINESWAKRANAGVHPYHSLDKLAKKLSRKSRIWNFWQKTTKIP